MLRRIGCEKSVEATEAAISIMGTTDEEQLRSLTDYREVDANDERMRSLEKCANQYYESGEDIFGKLFAFIQGNREQIDLLGIVASDEPPESVPVLGILHD